MRKSHRGFTLIEIVTVVGIIAVLVSIVLAVGATLAASQNIKRTQATMQILDSALDEYEALMRRQLTWGIDGIEPFVLPPGGFGAGGGGSAPPTDSRYDMQEDTMHVFLISDFLDDVGNSSDIRALLANIDGARYVRYEFDGTPPPAAPPAWVLEGGIASFQATEPDGLAGTWAADAPNWYNRHTILDAWDRPIRVIHPGRVWHDGDALAGPDQDGTVRNPLENQYGVAQRAMPYFVSAGPDGRFGDVSAPDGTDLKKATRDNIYSYEVE